MKQVMATVLGLVSVLVIWPMQGLAAEEAAKKEADTRILNDHTLLRTFAVLKTPVVIGPDGAFKEAFTPEMKRGKLIKTKIKDDQSPLPADEWRSADFSDFQWTRERVPVEKGQGNATGGSLRALHSATDSAVICARAKFMVDDPARAGDLTLSLKYVGGVVVFVNGMEVTRRHLPEGDLTPETLAEKYPDDLYITADGKAMQGVSGYAKRDEARFNRRYREARNVAIPASMLRKGLNVLALELHRAPVNEAATTVTRKAYGGMRRVYGLWAYVGLADLDLAATGSAAGMCPNLGTRPPGVQVWNCAPYATLSVNSFGDPGNQPRTVAIDAVRNGAFSGRFVVSADQEIEDLTVTVSDLVLEGGKARLPADVVALRHGRQARPSATKRPAHLFDALLPGVPARAGRSGGAVVPVWITVRPPKDAARGLYSGAVTVKAAGLGKTVLPLTCRVHGWTLPDPIDWRLKNLSVFGMYHVAAAYKVPLWSDKHFELLEQLFRLMAEVNARRVPVDMVPGVRYRREIPDDWAMFRLIPAKEGKGYTYDFSIIETVFDLVEKTMKAPQPLSVNCWGSDNPRDRTAKRLTRYVGWEYSSKNVLVLDPRTGTVTHVPNPPPGTEENERFWKPILTDLRKRIEKRGWYGATVIGHEAYCWHPNPKQVDVALRIWPDVVYGYSAHNGTLGMSFAGTGGRRVRCPYTECVWTQGALQPRGYRRLLRPGRDKNVWNSSQRNRFRDSATLAVYLDRAEEAIMRGHDGLGYLCADFFPMENPKRKGRYYHIMANRSGCQGNNTMALLGKGPDGPVATGRYEMFREGCQHSETILCLQRALDAKRIDGDLAARVNAYLDERSRLFLKSDWYRDRQALTRRLFALAAEVAARHGTANERTGQR